jgi:hypothetical protein
MRYLLLAMLAPGSVEAEVGRVQKSIFADHGLVSSIALPPLVPVAFLAEPALHGGMLSSLNASVAAPYRIVFAGARWHEDWLYLALETGGVWGCLRAAAPPESTGLFPAFEGFFLGCAEAKPAQRELVRPSLPAVGFTSSSLVIARIEASGQDGAWWREVSTEVLEEIPLRGRRRK